jgi:primosomal protein N''
MADDSARLSELYQKRKARLDKPGFAANLEALQKEIDALEQKLKDAEGGQT